jgi:hypothetical protein
MQDHWHQPALSCRRTSQEFPEILRDRQVNEWIAPRTHSISMQRWEYSVCLPTREITHTNISEVVKTKAHIFLCALVKLRKVTVSYFTSVCLSARNNSAPTGSISMKSDMRIFENLSRKFKFGKNRYCYKNSWLRFGTFRHGAAFTRLATLRVQAACHQYVQSSIRTFLKVLRSYTAVI